ncbi:YmaF family protein [Clostridium chromiireducens]|uniref:YmaF family protein n=1 Tax=Clostridium chromiireducens TaxID=225345 RepID=UPI003AF4606B
MGYNFKKGKNYKEHYSGNNQCAEKCAEKCEWVKNHNHEFLSSTDYAKDKECIIHNHRIAGVTGPAIRCGNSHVHKIETFTDTFCGHFHSVCDTTGPAISLPGGKHIHLVKGETSVNDGHDHDYFFTTLIEDPTNVPNDKDC